MMNPSVFKNNSCFFRCTHISRFAHKTEDIRKFISHYEIYEPAYFRKKILTLSFWIPAAKACILCQATKRNAFIFYSERIFIMNTTKNWVMRHLPYIGTAVLLCGIFCLIAKALSPEYLDAQGYLHENFFLLPISFPEKQILQINTKPLSVCILIPRGVPFFLIFCFLPPDDKSASRERKISPHIPS